MARPSEGPKCPQQAEIDAAVDLLNDVISMQEGGLTGPDKVECQQKINQLNRLIEILDWAGEQVNKRKLYSKKFQLKDKARTAILKERLGEDYDQIVSDAKNLAATQLSEEVANEEPTARELAELQADQQE